ncbi:hypothetical protein EV702DRAFT_1236232 [Suillus placidus]|uniref:DUF6532 domain-containing protein n=1 Tax=Suillus placidus TaxID=48579 RepID=A0A9P6ZRA6_9AGAM|nr:hypothetical protein EV702DRAFT_1236232 [Suillus placidus]
MAPRKPTSKQQKSKCAPSPPAAKQQVRTASGRERRPTEKENYRLSESQHVVRRQEIKENRTAKQKKKALKAAYQGHPDVFEKEPSELLSDIDRQEDTMFSDRSVHTRLSNTNSLTFSTGKIPPRLHNPSMPTTKGPKAPHNVDESTDDDDDADDDDDDNNEQLPAARGTKRPFDDMSPEDTVVLKVKKNADGSRQRVKASDFDEISKEILITACSVYRCLIVTQAPFPDSVAAEMKLAKEAWREACQLKGVDVKLTPSAVNMLLKRASHVRGELKTKMRPLTASFHGFRTSNSMEVIIRLLYDCSSHVLRIKAISCDCHTKLKVSKHKHVDYRCGRMWEKFENTPEYCNILCHILAAGIVLEVTDFSVVITRFSCRLSSEFAEDFP